MSTIGRCKLCGEALDSDSYGGQCIYCHRQLWELMEKKIFFFPNELLEYICSPTWIPVETAMKIAIIRAEAKDPNGKLTGLRKRSRIDIAIATAEESDTDEERHIIYDELIPCYKRHTQSMLESRKKAEESNKRLAEILARRNQKLCI